MTKDWARIYASSTTRGLTLATAVDLRWGYYQLFGFTLAPQPKTHASYSCGFTPDLRPTGLGLMLVL